MTQRTARAIRLLAIAAAIFPFALGQPGFAGVGPREVELTLVNPATRELPKQVEISFADSNGVRTTTSYEVSDPLRLRLPAMPIRIRVQAAGFEDVEMDVSSARQAVSLRPLASVRLEVPSQGQAPAASARVFVKNSHSPELTEIAGASVAPGEIAFRAPSGKWLGAALLNERRILMFSVSAAPAQKVQLQPAATVLTRALRVNVRDSDGAAMDPLVTWAFEQNLAVSNRQVASTPDLATKMTALCAEVLARTRSTREPGDMRVLVPVDDKGVLTLQAPGHRKASLSWEPLLGGVIPTVRLQRLPTLRITFLPRQRRSAGGTVAIFSAIDPISTAGPSRTTTKRIPLNVAGEATGTAIADSDHRIELRDAQGRLQGVEFVRRTDKDWQLDVISRTVRDADRMITGNVYWGNEPLPDARVVAMWLRDGVDTRFDRSSSDDFTVTSERIFDSADRTDASGRFALSVPIAGAYRVFAYHPELKYSKSSQPVDVTDLKTADVQIRLRDHFVVLEIREEDTGKPIAGAATVLRSKSGKNEDPASATFRFTSDEEGTIRVGDLLAGTLEGEVSAKGYRTRRLDLSPSTGFPVLPVKIELKKSGSCELQILDEAGAPAVGATVVAVGNEATATLFPSHLDLGSADDLGYVSTDSPSDGFPHLFVFAPGKQIKLIPYYFPAQGCGQRVLVLRKRETAIVPELQTENGFPLSRVQVALSSAGLFLPWNLTASALATEGLSGLMETGPNGEVQAAGLLEAGRWQLYAFKKQPEGSPELQKALGWFELPLSRPTVIKVKGGRP